MITHRKSLLALAIAATLTGVRAPSANASVTLFPGSYFGLTPVAQGSAVVDDPNLANYLTYDLKVVVSSSSGQDRWTAADMRVTFFGGGGQFYIPPTLDSNYLQPPAVRNAVGQRYLQMDTVVMSPVFDATRGAIVGKSVFAPASQAGPVFLSNGSNFVDPNDPSGTTFLPANSMDIVDVAWGDNQAAFYSDNADGTFTIARLSIHVGAFFVLQGRVTSSLDPSHPSTFVISDLPEPASVGVLAVSIGAVALRRRRRS